MTTRQSPERLVDLITAEIRSKLPTVFAALRTDRNDPRIETPLPAGYFVSEHIDPLQHPAIMVLCSDVDWQKELKGANHVNAKAAIKVVCVVENRTTEILTRQVYRYSDALQEILDQLSLTSQNSKVSMKLVVTRTSFTPVYTPAQKKGETSGVFRKEVVLECDAYHYENF